MRDRDREKNQIRHQYITVKRSKGLVYVEGSYDEEYVKFIKALPIIDRIWQPEFKRWAINIEHLAKITDKARATFTKVLYGEGGDYEEITIGGVTWKQDRLDL